MKSNTTLPSPIEEPPPPVLPEATEEQISAFLAQLRTRRRELVDHFAIEAGGDDAGLAVSALWPLVYVEVSIRAVEATLAEQQ